MAQSYSSPSELRANSHSLYSDLYSEVNGFGQTTFTWLAATNITDFNGDVGPLINGLEAYGGPKPTDYLGYVAFGTEAFHATQNATFYNSKLELKVLM